MLAAMPLLAIWMHLKPGKAIREIVKEAGWADKGKSEDNRKMNATEQVKERVRIIRKLMPHPYYVARIYEECGYTIS